VALGVYPHFVVDRTESDTEKSIAKAQQLSGAEQAAARDDDAGRARDVVGDHP
jgi:hypothetical protein